MSYNLAFFVDPNGVARGAFARTLLAGPCVWDGLIAYRTPAGVPGAAGNPFTVRDGETILYQSDLNSLNSVAQVIRGAVLIRSALIVAWDTSAQPGPYPGLTVLARPLAETPDEVAARAMLAVRDAVQGVAARLAALDARLAQVLDAAGTHGL